MLNHWLTYTADGGCALDQWDQPSGRYAGWPLDLLRARRAKNASEIAPIAEGLSTTACRRKRTGEAEKGHLSRG
jgi:hypothetical protein